MIYIGYGIYEYCGSEKCTSKEYFDFTFQTCKSCNKLTCKTCNSFNTCLSCYDELNFELINGTMC